MDSSTNRQGFTLIEIMITISIMAITFGVIISSAAGVRKNSRDAQRQSDLRTIQSALQSYYADQNYFPDSMTLTSSTRLSECPTAPASGGCTGTKSYLEVTPIDPTGTTAYAYRSGADSTTANRGNNCAGASTKGCHFYMLCAKLEGTSPQAAAQYADCTANFSGSAYNFQLNP